MSDEKFKSPDEAAESQMNKKIGSAIAKRKMKIRQLEAEIKKLKSGEMVPDEDDDESSHHNKEEKIKEVIRERIIEINPPKPSPFEIDPYKDQDRRPFYPDLWRRRTPFEPWYGTRWKTTCSNYC